MAHLNGTANPGATPGANGNPSPTPSTAAGHSNETLYKAVKSQQRFEKLHSRFSGGKSFAEENQKWRTVAVVTSYLINALSIAGAFYGAVWLFGWFGAGKEVSYVLAAALLLMVEIGRRWAADFVWDKWFHLGKVAAAFLALNIALFVVSATSSGFGIYRGIVDNSQPAPTLSDSTLIKMEGEAAAIRGDIETAKDTKWKGTVTVDAQKAIKSSSKSLATLTDAITDRRAKLSSKQETAETEHTADVRTVGLIAVAIYLFLELIFQICVRFVSLYDYREFLSRTEQGQKSIAPTPSAAALQVDPATLAQLVGNARSGGVHSLNIVSPGFAAYMGHGTTGANDNRKEVLTDNNGADLLNDNRKEQAILRQQDSPDFTDANDNRLNENRKASTTDKGKERTCCHCGQPYIYGHIKQKYCSDNCRITAWQQRTNATVKKRKRKA